MAKIYTVFFTSFFCLLVLPSILHAQYENIWLCGENSGLDFNNGNPIAIQTNFNPNFNTGFDRRPFGANVCDGNGQILFYTDADRVFDRNGNLMPNGAGITPPSYIYPGQPSAISALIVPMPDSNDKYYIFTLSNIGEDYSIGNFNGARLFYSVLDMSLNNGLGDIIPNRKRIKIDSMMTGKLTGVRGDRCNIWVLSSSSVDPTGAIKAYEITASGLNTNPVISPGAGHDITGCITVSPDRKKIATTVTWFPYFNSFGNEENSINVYDFDPATGIASNYYTVQLPVFTPAGMVCFSPDNSKLYVHRTPATAAPYLTQYDLSSNNPSIIINTGVYLGLGLGLKIAPDGNKIYTLNFTGNAALANQYGSIDAPNIAGTACQYVPFVGNFLPGTLANPFPNVVPRLIHDTAYYDTTITRCISPQDALVLEARDTAGWDYTWSDGSGATGLIVTMPGTYQVTYHTAPCVWHNETYTIKPLVDVTISLGPDTTICNSSYPLQVSVPGAAYLWQDGSIGNHFEPNSSGTYWVQVTKGSCSYTDTLQLNLIHVEQDLGSDLTLCAGDPLSVALSAYLPAGATALWSTGSTDPSVTVTDTGTYWLKVMDSSCTGTDTIRITQEFCNCHFDMASAFSPNGDGLNDIFMPVLETGCPIQDYVLNIYNRFGQRIYSGTNIRQGWDGSQGGLPAEVGTYMYEVNCKAGTKGKQYYRKGDITLIR